MICTFRQPSHVIYLQVKAQKLVTDTLFKFLWLPAFWIAHKSLYLSQVFPDHILIKSSIYKLFGFLST